MFLVLPSERGSPISFPACLTALSQRTGQPIMIDWRGIESPPSSSQHPGIILAWKKRGIRDQNKLSRLSSCIASLLHPPLITHTYYKQQSHLLLSLSATSGLGNRWRDEELLHPAWKGKGGPSAASPPQAWEGVMSLSRINLCILGKNINGGV